MVFATMFLSPSFSSSRLLRHADALISSVSILGLTDNRPWRHPNACACTNASSLRKMALASLPSKYSVRKFATSASNDAGHKQHACWARPHHHSLLAALAEHARAIPIEARRVEVLRSPAEFYESLKEGISGAKDRIIMASLYLGVGQLECELLDLIADTVISRPELRVTLLFDALRSTRPSPTHDGTMITSAEMISKQLLSRLRKSDKPIEFGIDKGGRVRVGLYHTPDLTRMLKWLLPVRWNEVVGVCHIKAYIFDDNVLISGANLSSSYFTNRQDRYIWIHQSSELANYLCNLVSTVANFSYSLTDESKVFANPSLVDPVYEPKAYRDRLSEAVNSLVLLRPDMELSKRKQNKIKNTGDSGLWLNNVCANTWVFPTVQMGPVGVEQDELCTLSMLRRLPAGSHLDFSSAYFNLTPEFESVLLEASADKEVDILTASPEANGFYGSRGASGLIPIVYSLLEQSLYRRAEKAHKEGTLFKVNNVLADESGRLRILEYKKENWTFHAKGLWCSLPGEGLTPSITLVGSSNFGHRSKHKDLEAQLLLMTSEPSLRQSLKQEKDLLYSYAKIVNENTFRDKGRAHGTAAILAAHIVRSWL